MLVGIWGYNVSSRDSINSGKGTVADMMVKASKAKYPNVSIKGFADKLKQNVAELYGIPLENCYTHEGKDKTYSELNGNTLRYALQKYGEFCRVINPDVWVNYLTSNTYADELVLVADLRHENEAIAIKESGGYILSVIRCDDQEIIDYFETPLVRRQGNLTDEQYLVKLITEGYPEDVHESESQLHKLIQYTDRFIYNFYHLENLESQVRSFSLSI